MKNTQLREALGAVLLGVVLLINTSSIGLRAYLRSLIEERGIYPASPQG